MAVADVPEDDIIKSARVKRVLVKPQEPTKFLSGTAISVPTFLCLCCAMNSFTDTGKAWRNARIFSRSCSFVVNHERSRSALQLFKQVFHASEQVVFVSGRSFPVRNRSPPPSPAGVSGNFSEMNFRARSSKYSINDASNAGPGHRCLSPISVRVAKESDFLLRQQTTSDRLIRFEKHDSAEKAYRFRQQRQFDLRDHAERPFASDKKIDRVHAGLGEKAADVFSNFADDRRSELSYANHLSSGVQMSIVARFTRGIIAAP